MENDIQVLIDKSLIKIVYGGFVRVHDFLVQDMGREIVRQESKLEHGRRSRLWSDDDKVHVLEENTLCYNLKTSLWFFLFLGFLMIYIHCCSD